MASPSSFLRPLAACLLALSSVLPASAAPSPFVQLVQVASGLSSPVAVTHAQDGSNRLFIVEQCGRIRIWNGSALLPAPFLDLGATGSDLIACGGERGLLGLAFHPAYAANGFFYVYYTRKSDGDIIVARYQVSTNPNVANTSGLILLSIDHPLSNHNGGQLAFGPDGYLYIATGDGGGGGDPDDNGQNLNSLLGKILRIDVNSDGFPADPNRNYAIPANNPFADATAGADEIWAYGLRNPWRFSFDRSTGDLYIGDVGQGSWEEIDFQPAASPGGANYGWDVLEGRNCFEDSPAGSCAAFLGGGSVLPVLEYDHSLGCSVTGGFVFRNLPLHLLSGSYLYGDFCSGRIWRGIPNGAGGWTSQQMFDTSFGISSFGESETGRIYFTDLSGNTLQWLAPYTFQDVPADFWAWQYIEALAASGITGGCGSDQYCPAAFLTRAETAVFLVRALRGSAFIPPPASGTTFQDVPASYWAASFIEQISADGITRGCGATQYCPDASLTRAQAAVLLLRARHGRDYTPPAGSGTAFNDVPAGYWAVSWIEQLAAEGITGGCGGGSYCPDRPMTRAEMAVLMTRAFALPSP